MGVLNEKRCKENARLWNNKKHTRRIFRSVNTFDVSKEERGEGGGWRGEEATFMRK